uniref:Uncharacterized protein n=1 Tax=Setaria viridis TaxID=4556 RepID=A0A4U6V869_SETVI|nr:hypothetical protein SEVIR_3G040800v2 [Setaria viridis]
MATPTSVVAEGAASESELVSIPATLHGLSMLESATTPTSGGGSGRSKSTVGTPGRRVVEGLCGYLEDVGYLTRLDAQRRPRVPNAPPPTHVPGTRMDGVDVGRRGRGRRARLRKNKCPGGAPPPPAELEPLAGQARSPSSPVGQARAPSWEREGGGGRRREEMEGVTAGVGEGGAGADVGREGGVGYWHGRRRSSRRARGSRPSAWGVRRRGSGASGVGSQVPGGPGGEDGVKNKEDDTWDPQLIGGTYY